MHPRTARKTGRGYALAKDTNASSGDTAQNMEHASTLIDLLETPEFLQIAERLSLEADPKGLVPQPGRTSTDMLSSVYHRLTDIKGGVKPRLNPHEIRFLSDILAEAKKAPATPEGNDSLRQFSAALIGLHSASIVLPTSTQQR